MPETSTTPQLPSPFFGIQRIFAQDLSLETVGIQSDATLQNARLELHFDVRHEPQGEDVHLASLRTTLSARDDVSVKFVLEVVQSGLFVARGFTPEQLGEVINVSCMAILAPYVRAALSDTLARAGLPPYLLPEVNWVATYASLRAKAAEAERTAAANPGSVH